MTSITFQCTNCEADFELEIARLIERPTSIKCTNCKSKPVVQRVEAFASALEDVVATMSALRNKIRFEVNLDTDELPPPYGALQPSEASRLGALSSSDDDDEDDDLEDDDEDEFLEDEDEDVFSSDDDDDDDFDDDDDEEEDY